MIERIGTYTFLMIGHLYIGDGTKTTTLTETNKSMEFLALSRFFITANATFQLGNEVTNSGITQGVNGGKLMLRNAYQDAMMEQICLIQQQPT